MCGARGGKPSLTPDDIAVTICQSCSAITREADKPAAELSVFEVLDADADFLWPNLRGETLTLQICGPEDLQRRMEEQALQIQTARAVGYCNACVRGLRQGGARAEHLMALILGTDAR